METKQLKRLPVGIQTFEKLIDNDMLYIDIPNTKFKYETFETGLTKCQGVHDLYFVFKSTSMQKRNLFNFDWWETKK